ASPELTGGIDGLADKAPGAQPQRDAPALPEVEHEILAVHVTQPPDRRLAALAAEQEVAEHGVGLEPLADGHLERVACAAGVYQIASPLAQREPGAQRGSRDGQGGRGGALAGGRAGDREEQEDDGLDEHGPLPFFFPRRPAGARRPPGDRRALRRAEAGRPGLATL